MNFFSSWLPKRSYTTPKAQKKQARRASNRAGTRSGTRTTTTRPQTGGVRTTGGVRNIAPSRYTTPFHNTRRVQDVRKSTRPTGTTDRPGPATSLSFSRFFV